MSKGIKSIKVSLRPVHLAIGDVVYTYRDNYIKKFVVTSKPYNKHPYVTFAIWVCDVEQIYLPTTDRTYDSLRYVRMHPGQIYLGDDGVEGYRYDNRPSGIGCTEEGARMRYQHYRKWLARNKTN